MRDVAGAGGLAVAVSLITLSVACATRTPATAPRSDGGAVVEVREGFASYYGPGLQGRTMASGARFDMNALVAAHPSYPFGTRVRVTNLENGRSLTVRILDRGPAARIQAEGVIIDVSRGAARRLGFLRSGRVRVRLEVLQLGSP